MMSLFIQLFIKNKEDVSNPSVKKAYAALSSIVGILLNLFCVWQKFRLDYSVILLPFQQMDLITCQMQGQTWCHFWDLRLQDMAEGVHIPSVMEELSGLWAFLHLSQFCFWE